MGVNLNPSKCFAMSSLCLARHASETKRAYATLQHTHVLKKKKNDEQKAADSGSYHSLEREKGSFRGYSASGGPLSSVVRIKGDGALLFQSSVAAAQ